LPVAFGILKGAGSATKRNRLFLSNKKRTGSRPEKYNLTFFKMLGRFFRNFYQEKILGGGKNDFIDKS